jgi:hypothetical protein
MLTLTDLISKGVIKAVLAAKEDRLFRDETPLEYKTFIQVCKKHNCLVIIPPYTIYNFANKRHVKEFRYQCEKAADFLEDDRIIPNPTYKKHIRYEPHAQVIDWCLEQFYKTHSLNGIVREAEQKGIRFPEFAVDIDQRNRRIAAKHMEDEQGGYLITIALLVSVFTNAFYEGHLVLRQVTYGIRDVTRIPNIQRQN